MAGVPMRQGDGNPFEVKKALEAAGEDRRVVGCPIEYADRTVQRHFGVTDDNAAFAGGQLAHDIEMSKAMTAALAKKN